MPHNDTDLGQVPWRAMRLATGLSQREVERRLGWAQGKKGHGYLSLIERGVVPTPEQEAQLKAFYADALIRP